MQIFTFSFLDCHKYQKEYLGFLELRKQVLVDNLGWDLRVAGTTESDQYDNPNAIYSLVEADGRVVAGARAAPCSAKWAGWSYMLKDADLGKIPGIPQGLLPSYPLHNTVWECTRFVSDDGFGTSEERLKVTRLVVAGLCFLSGSLGATRLLSLSPAALGRLLRSFGYEVGIAGKAYVCADDGRRYRPFNMACDMSVNSDLLSAYSAQRVYPKTQQEHLSFVSSETEQSGNAQ